MKQSKVPYVIIISCVAIAGAIFFMRFVFGGPEDTWMCVSGAWVMHGKPAAAKPTIPCIK